MRKTTARFLQRALLAGAFLPLLMFVPLSETAAAAVPSFTVTVTNPVVNAPLSNTPAAGGPSFAATITRPGVYTFNRPNGNVIVVSATSSASGPRTHPGADPSNNVTVGINEYNCCGTLLWTFTETVYWSWDGSQVLSDSPSTGASTSAPAWYVASKPDPYTFWDQYPIREGNHGEATFACCYFVQNQTMNPIITIIVDALGGWSAQTQCTGC